MSASPLVAASAMPPWQTRYAGEPAVTRYSPSVPNTQHPVGVAATLRMSVVPAGSTYSVA
ncbi:hypothetical protein IA539_14240 [Gordonia sp. zg691]|nr:hypothetical protein [Gordonia jinghuaiqii]